MSKKTVNKTIATLSAIMLIGGIGGQISPVFADTYESHAKSFMSSMDFSSGAVIKSANMSKVVADLSVSDTGSAECIVRITGKVNATKISATMKLQRYDLSRKSWINVTQWTNSVDSGRMFLKKRHSLKAKGNYRLYVSVNVWSGDKKETLTKISSQKTY